MTVLRKPVVDTTSRCLLVLFFVIGCFLSAFVYGVAQGAGGGVEMAAPNTLTPKQERAGWRLLFDGTSPETHWRGYRNEEFPAHWAAENGWLVTTGPGEDLATREKFESFELEFEWIISPGGNSGVFYLVQDETPRIWHAAPEYQILDNAFVEDPKGQAGALYDMISPAKDVTRPVGEVNTGRIVMDGRRIEHHMNEHKLLSIEVGSEEWNRLVEGSKFADLPFAQVMKGRIALQVHGENRVSFRNIRIRPLDAVNAGHPE